MQINYITLHYYWRNHCIYDHSRDHRPIRQVLTFCMMPHFVTKLMVLQWDHP